MNTLGAKPPKHSDRDTALEVNSHRKLRRTNISQRILFLRNIWGNDASMASFQVVASYRALTASIRKLGEIVQGSSIGKILRLTLKLARSDEVLIRLIAITQMLNIFDKIVEYISRLPL